jgi:uncharacterized protein with HEPN domain
MPRRNKWIRLRHMLDHAQEALALARGRTRNELDSDRLLNLALVRLLEVVGEAANRVPKEEQSLHPEIPWPSIVGLRHRLIHGYDMVDNDILWQVIIQDLPSLVVQLEAILAQSDNE